VSEPQPKKPGVPNVEPLISPGVGIKVSTLEAAFKPLKLQTIFDQAFKPLQAQSVLAKVLSPAADLQRFMPTLSPSVKNILNLQGACGTSVLGKINAQQRTFTSDVLKIAEKHSLVSGINIAKNSSLFAAIQPAPLISDTLMRSLRVQSPLANLDFAPQVRLIEQQANFKLPDYGAVLSVMPLSWGKSLIPDMTMFDFGETSLFANAQAIFQQSLGDLLGGWTRDLFESTRSMVRAFARIGLEAALRARHAVLSGDTAEVDYFIKEWLELRVTRLRREVVIEVLLSDEWVPASLEPPSTEVVRHIKALATDKNRSRKYRFIGGTQIKGQTIQSLDRSIYLPSGGEVPLAETVADPYSDPAFMSDLGWEDPLIGKVLEHLAANEREIFLAHGRVNTWPDAAALVGRSEQEGEATRRRVRGFVRMQQKRDQAAREFRAAHESY